MRLRNIINFVKESEPFIVSRKNNRNVVIVSEHEYNELVKAKKNAEYLAKIDESIENHKRGDTISFTMKELREMEAEDWTPTEKVLEFERKYGIRRNGDTST